VDTLRKRQGSRETRRQGRADFIVDGGGSWRINSPEIQQRGKK
jgi:hypothetical protein